MKTLHASIVLPLLLTSSLVHAAESLSPDLQRGLFEEEANQNFDAAIKAYQSVLTSHDNERKLAATALFRLGECYRKLGRTNDAVTQYRRLVADFADQAALANLSRQNLVGLGVWTSPDDAFDSAGTGAQVLIQQRAIAAEMAEAGQLESLVKQLTNRSRLELRRVLPTVAPDGLLNGLLQQLSQEEQTLSALSATRAAEHPEVKAAKVKIAVLSGQIDERLEGVMNGLKVKADALAQKSETLKRELARLSAARRPPGKGEDSGGADPAARAQLRELLQSEIKIAEQFAAEQRKKVEVGTLAPGDQVRFERDVLNLKRQLVAVDGLVSAEDRSQWRELLLREIKLAEEAAQSEKQKLDTGRTVASEVARLQRDVLILKRELVTFDANPAPAASTGGDARAGFAQRLQTIVQSSAGGAITDEEEKEIRRTEALIRNSPDLINAVEGGGYMPLHSVASKGHLRVAEFLIANGANVNAYSLYNGLPSGPTPLRAAAAAGHKKMVELLLSKGASVQAGGNRTALHDAAEKGYRSIVEVLLANKADVNARDGKDATPLVYAVKNNHLDVARLLLGNKAETEIKCTTYLSGASGTLRDFSGQYPLHVAVRSRNQEMVALLLESGANPNVQVDSKESNDSPGATPLVLAVYYKLKPAILTLLKAKADPAIAGADMHNSLHAAVVAPELLELLLENQVSPNITNQTGATALHWAARNRNLEAAKILIKHGADINATDQVGYTPLHSAAQAGDPETVRFLIANKANLNARNKDGDPPLELARRVSSSARYTIVEMLLQYGAAADVPRFDRIAVRRSATSSLQAVFQKGGTNDWNRFTLLELIAVKYGLLSSSADGSVPVRARDRVDLFFINRMNSSDGLPFPDLERVVIRRPEPDGTRWKEIPTDLARLSAPVGNDCPGDIPLAWGDVVEIPELDHLSADRWTGFNSASLMTLHRCLSRAIRVAIKGEATTLKLAPDLEFRPGDIPSLVTYRRFMLVPVLKESRLLRNTSDLSRVTVTRRSGAGQAPQKWVLDCANGNPDLWLRDGDEIEVPER